MLVFVLHIRVLVGYIFKTHFHFVFMLRYLGEEDMFSRLVSIFFWQLRFLEEFEKEVIFICILNVDWERTKFTVVLKSYPESCAKIYFEKKNLN